MKPDVKTIPLAGYAPDLDPAAPGVFSYCLGVEPTMKGWRLQRSKSTITATSMAAFTSGSFILDGLFSVITDGTVVHHVAIYDAGAAKYKLYRGANGGTLTDASRAGQYTFAGTENFVFCQYGNYTLATNLIDVLQIRDASGTGAFADSAATGIPKAKIAVTWGNPSAQRVMLLYYNDGSAYPDGWWTSSFGGPADVWTPNIATGAANGRLIGAGPLTCGIAFRDTIVAFSGRSMWIGRMADPPILVSWEQISDDIGCVGPYAATVVDGILYWVSAQGVFFYDGTYPQRLPIAIQEEIATAVFNSTAQQLIHVVAHGRRLRLRIAVRTGGYTSSLAISKLYSMHIVNNKVGLHGTAAPSSTSYQLAMDNSRIAYLVAGGEATVQADQDTPVAASLTDLYGFGLPYMGSDKGETQINGVIPRFASAPTTYKCTPYYGRTMAETLGSTGVATTVTATPWRADVVQTANWHAPRFHFSSNGTDDPEVLDVSVIADRVGAQ